MILSKLVLRKFGPFRQYEVPFVAEEQVVLLLTGKNNEGKSNIILSLRLIHAALQVLNKARQEIIIAGEYFYRLLQQDIDKMLLGRLVYNYEDDIAKISAEFSSGLKVNVYIDPKEDIVYADYVGRLPSSQVFGFVPALGPLAEVEEILSVNHLRKSIDTSLAPRHLRNHFAQILSPDEYMMVRDIVNSTWKDIDLRDFSINYQLNRIDCFYMERRITREIGWAGQGLQVWFQIVAHLVRLRHCSTIVLDEPEINLHPEKQNDLMRVLKEHYDGTIIIATHSVELMNNVSVDHIVHVEKNKRKPIINKTSDRASLEIIRAQVGSSFNLIASQYDSYDLILFTEDHFDFILLQQLAGAFGIETNVLNIPLHGFSEYNKAQFYKEAYELILGHSTDYTVVLDRDYYPEDYLETVQNSIQSTRIRSVFTPGKEIENVFLHPDVLRYLFPSDMIESFDRIWEQLFKDEYLESYGSYLTLHKQFLPNNVDMKTITTKYTPSFESCWNDIDRRHLIVPGKVSLKRLRRFYRDQHGNNLTQQMLIRALAKNDSAKIKAFIEEVYHVIPASNNILKY